MVRKENPVRYSSAVGELWVHASFKAKYTHMIFDVTSVREATEVLLLEALEKYEIPCRKIGFDNNHVHMMIDINNLSRPQVAKCLKGYIARKLFKQMPWVKKEYFWGSGMWSPAYYMNSVGKDMDFIDNYIGKQKYAQKGIVQKKLSAY